MSENITVTTPADIAEGVGGHAKAPEAPAAAPEPAAPTPAKPVEQEAAEPKVFDQAYVEKLRKENASYRTKLREAEPIVEEYNKKLEAEKTDLERANERIAELERTAAVDALARTHNLTEEDINFLGSGTQEELEARAQHLGSLRANITPAETKAPPTDRPVESLRPGASPQPQQVEDNSYPAAWRPAARERS